MQAIVTQGLSVFIAGDFEAVDGGRVAARGVALFFGGRWYPLRDGLNGPGHALAVVQNCVIVGGSFSMYPVFLSFRVYNCVSHSAVQGRKHHCYRCCSLLRWQPRWSMGDVQRQGMAALFYLNSLFSLKADSM